MDPDRFRTRATTERDDLGGFVLVLEHRYADPAERVWRAITDGDQISSWFGVPVEIDSAEGGEVVVTFSPEVVVRGRITLLDPPRLLVHTGRDEVFRWEVRAEGDGCVLTLRDTMADPGHAHLSAAGFHLSLDALEVMLDEEAGRPVGPSELPGFQQLARYYETALRPGAG